MWEFAGDLSFQEYEQAVRAARALEDKRTSLNQRYFKQPSGFSEHAENVENLPGGRTYYTNQAKDKTDAWIKQFIDAEWGFSVSGQPVVPSFNPEMHTPKKGVRLLFNPNIPLVVGYDPGMGGSALIFGQEDLHGRLLVFAELVQENYSTERLIIERLKPFLHTFFPGAKVIVAPDPAAANRAQTDAKSSVDIMKRHFNVQVEQNNRFPLRLNAMEHYTSRLTSLGPALQIDPVRCPTLVRALKGGWRYVVDQKKGVVTAMEPEKNKYSHPGDGFGYLCRFFHRQNERTSIYGAAGAKPFTPPRTFTPGYHFR
jgi:hypothetical protein